MASRTAPALLAVLLVVTLAASVTAAGIELVSSTESGIVLRYEPGTLSRHAITVDGREYSVLSVGGTVPMGLPGAPDVPVFRAVLAVPDCDDISLSVSTVGTSSERGAAVAPALSVVPVGPGEVSRYEYARGEQYDTAGLWPPRAASITEPSMLSSQRVVHLELFPCQVDGTSGALVSHEAIEVALTFTGVRTHPLPRTSPRWEALFRSVVTNYDSGRSWRYRAAPSRGRPEEYFDTSQNWLKLTVSERGMHGIGYDDLVAADVDPGGVDPASIRVFTGTGLSLPTDPNEARPDWMEECAIAVEGEGDGSFDQGDRVAFFAIGLDAWNDEVGVVHDYDVYHENRFANDAVYWMTWESDGTPFADPPRRIAADELSDDPDPTVVTDYRARKHFEDNRYEFQGTGDNFYMYEMKQRTPERRYFHEPLSRVVTDSMGVLRARVDGNSSVYGVTPDHIVYFYLNEVEADVGEWDSYAPYVFEAGGIPIRDYLPDEPGNDYNTFEVYMPRDTGYEDDTIIIDWFEIEYWRELWADLFPDDGLVEDRIEFGSSGRSGAIEYSLGGFETGDVSVFKVLDRYTVLSVPGVVTSEDARGFSASFQNDVADTASYLAVADGGYILPGVEKDAVRSLRSDTNIDYVMVAHDEFYDEALRLKSYRESAAGGGYSVALARVSDVYDEFSWGVADPAAIRDYFKYLADNAVVPPTHALLIGDATSDYRHYQTAGIPCYIPTFYTGSHYWPTDVWFVGFEGTSQYEPGMALGRMSVRSSSELATIIDKVERYEQDTVQGPWKNTVVLVGDDEWRDNHDEPSPSFEYTHTLQAEQIDVEVLPWSIDRRKIYLMEYEFDAAWHKPAARVDVIDAWNEGCLVMNYTGHGNELLMAHELVFLVDDIPLLKNIDSLPLFFAASCRLNKFDMPSSDSVGELLVKSPVGGTIASIGSTRDSGAGYNSALNRAFLAWTFGDQRDAPTAFLDVGQAFQTGFIETAAHYNIWLNNTKFAIVGDPALRLASPSGWGAFDDTELEPMRRRDTVTIEGENSGSTEGESGVALIRVTDTADTSGYIQPLSQFRVRYELPGDALYEGAAVVTDGSFTTDFVVSALAEEGPNARLRAYFYGTGGDGSFSVEDVDLADSVAVSDATGPSISIDFEGGGTSVQPGDEFEIRLSDENGINLINRDSSDGIIMSVDNDAESTDVTALFSYDLGSFTEGAITQELPLMGLGSHSIRVDASDNMGNRSSSSLQFEIISSEEFTIRNVANHPNPFPSGADAGTRIMFQLPVSAAVTVDVFTVGGRRIRQLGETPCAAGANEIYWDGRDEQGDELANGVYLFRIHAVSDEYGGDKADAIGRAVVMR